MAGGYSTLGLLHLAPARCRFMERHGDLAVGHWLPMTIAGLWVGIDIWRRSRKQGKSFSPYRKKWYHWHYVTGIVFGLFVLTFCFSGMMSLAEVPSWISKPVLDKNPTREIKKGAPRLEQYVLDYRRILTEYPDVRQIEWSNFRSQPYYIVKRSEGDLYIDASDSLSRR